MVCADQEIVRSLLKQCCSVDFVMPRSLHIQIVSPVFSPKTEQPYRRNADSLAARRQSTLVGGTAVNSDHGKAEVPRKHRCSYEKKVPEIAFGIRWEGEHSTVKQQQNSFPYIL